VEIVSRKIQGLQLPQFTEGLPMDLGTFEFIVAQIQFFKEVSGSKVIPVNLRDLVMKDHKCFHSTGQPTGNPFQHVVVQVDSVKFL